MAVPVTDGAVYVNSAWLAFSLNELVGGSVAEPVADGAVKVNSAWSASPVTPGMSGVVADPVADGDVKVNSAWSASPDAGAMASSLVRVRMNRSSSAIPVSIVSCAELTLCLTLVADASVRSELSSVNTFVKSYWKWN